MRILIVGNGGREHALAWKLSQSPLVRKIYVAPGNGGSETEPQVENVDIDATDIEKLCQFAKNQAIDLTLVGPETALVLGIVDRFQDEGLTCFGPNQKAAELEGSKAFAKAFMNKHHIPTANFKVFQNLTLAKQYISTCNLPVVIKVDGLAAGKGVSIVHTQAEAEQILNALLGNNFNENSSQASSENQSKNFSEISSKSICGKGFDSKNSSNAHQQTVVIEEFLEGEELSFIVLTDGKHALPFATAQDHKTRDNHDLGPNTGGMGAYSPSPVLTDSLQKRIMKTIVFPTLKGMANIGRPFTGFLYCGLMIDSAGNPKVLEYNCRLGDPETQVILPRLKTDLVDLILGAMNNTLNTMQAEWDSQKSLGVVLVSGGYPEQFQINKEIIGLPSKPTMLSNTDRNKIFHAGTKKEGDVFTTQGGRVLCITALGDSVTEAQNKVYKTISSIHWEGIYYRTDIGYRACDKERNSAGNSVTIPANV